MQDALSAQNHAELVEACTYLGLTAPPADSTSPPPGGRVLIIALWRKLQQLEQRLAALEH